MELKLLPLRLSTTAASFEADFKARLHWAADTDAAIEQRVADILADVQRAAMPPCWNTPTALTSSAPPRWPRWSWARPNSRPLSTPSPPRSATRCRLLPGAFAATTKHKRRPVGETWTYRDEDGTLLGQKVTPLDRVGIYVPGGKAAYPSSLLMNAIPAHVAGVSEIIMVVPTPARRTSLVLAAGYVAGVTRAFTIGGAQAVARWPTARNRARVDKITGPGNAYVASAKRRVFGQVGIDMIAGPAKSWCWPTAPPARLGGHGPVQPGRARRAGAKHPAVPRRRLHRPPCRPKSTACCPPCRAPPSLPRA
jgi:histidinol dehydrogenase